MGVRFNRFIDRVVLYIAPPAIVRGNVVVILRGEICDQGIAHPTFEICRFRKWNLFKRFRPARGFSFQDLDDLTCILNDLNKNLSHEEISAWIN